MTLCTLKREKANHTNTFIALNQWGNSFAPCKLSIIHYPMSIFPAFKPFKYQPFKSSFMMSETSEDTVKRKRKPKWTQDQLLLLVQFVLERRRIMKGKFGSGVTSKKKLEAWEEICFSIFCESWVDPRHFAPTSRMLKFASKTTCVLMEWTFFRLTNTYSSIDDAIMLICVPSKAPTTPGMPAISGMQ